MLKYNEIIKKSKNIKPKKIQGVYFLILNTKIVYIGSSNNILIRLKAHNKDSNKIFNKISYIIYDDESKMKLDEKKYILKYRPRYNKKDNPDVFYKSQSYLARKLQN